MNASGEKRYSAFRDLGWLGWWVVKDGTGNVTHFSKYSSHILNLNRLRWVSAVFLF